MPFQKRSRPPAAHLGIGHRWEENHALADTGVGVGYLWECECGSYYYVNHDQGQVSMDYQGPSECPMKGKHMRKKPKPKPKPRPKPGY